MPEELSKLRWMARRKSRLPSVPVAQFEGEDHPIEFTRVDSQPRLSQQHGQDHPRVDGPPIESVQFLADGIYQPIAPSTDAVDHPGQERVEERGRFHRPVVRHHGRRILPLQCGHRELRSEEHSLNSSHLVISYAVFCLKKKKNKSSVMHDARFVYTACVA